MASVRQGGVRDPGPGPSSGQQKGPTQGQVFAITVPTEPPLAGAQQT